MLHPIVYWLGLSFKFWKSRWQLWPGLNILSQLTLRSLLLSPWLVSSANSKRWLADVLTPLTSDTPGPDNMATSSSSLYTSPAPGPRSFVCLCMIYALDSEDSIKFLGSRTLNNFSCFSLDGEGILMRSWPGNMMSSYSRIYFCGRPPRVKTGFFFANDVCPHVNLEITMPINAFTWAT